MLTNICERAGDSTDMRPPELLVPNNGSVAVEAPDFENPVPSNTDLNQWAAHAPTSLCPPYGDPTNGRF